MFDERNYLPWISSIRRTKGRYVRALLCYNNSYFESCCCYFCEKKIDKIHLGAKEFAFTDQLFVLVELDAVPQTHSAGAEETWNETETLIAARLLIF